MWQLRLAPKQKRLFAWNVFFILSAIVAIANHNRFALGLGGMAWLWSKRTKEIKKHAIYAYITRRVSLLLLLPRRVSFNVNWAYVVTPLPFRTFVIVFFMEFVLSNFLLFSTTSWVTKEKSENVNNAFGTHLWDNLKVFVRTPIVCWTRNNNNNGYSFTVTGAILWHYL